MRKPWRCLRRRSFRGTLLICCFLVFGSYTPVCLSQGTPTTPAPTTPAPSPSTTTPPAPIAAEVLTRLKARLDFEIDDKRVETHLMSPEANKVVVTLRGDLDTTQEEEDLMAVVRRIMPEADIRRRLFIKSPGPATASEQEVTDLWILTYIRSRVTSTGTSSQNSNTPDNIVLLVEALNKIYGLPGKPVVQQAGVGRLLLRGPRRKVLEIKRFLALIDSPWPQVQMNMWAVQVTGSPEDVSRRIEQISSRTRMVRDQMQEVQRKLAQLVVGDRESNLEHWPKLENNFRKAGVDFPVDGPLSLNESLILLTLHPSRQEKVQALKTFVDGEWQTWTEQWNGEQAAPPIPVFQRLVKLFSGTSHAADENAFLRFGNSLFCFKDEGRVMSRPDASHSLVRTGAVVDRVLKAVMDAFAADMADLFLDPLLRDLQGSVAQKKDNGIALVGRSRIVVTSGLEAGLAPEMASFVESSIPKPFGKELLDMAFPASATGTSTADALTGASKVLAGLSDGQALALAALLMGETEPAYTKVAPGIAVNVRPSVLPDGGAARLTIDARFGVESEPQDTDRTDIWRMAPPAGIKSHSVRTDAAVSAFDLFDISSFSVTASHPQTPFYVPILGRLPIIGKAFQFPRRNKEVLFESLVLVNTVILPRSIELHRFYGRNIDSEQNSQMDSKCREEKAPAAVVKEPQPAQ